MWTTKFYLSLFSFWSTKTRYSTQVNANNSVLAKKPIKEMRRLESLPATKNHQGLEDSEDESNAKVFSVSDPETGQQSSPHIQLEMIRRQPQQGNAVRVLVENGNFRSANLPTSLWNFHSTKVYKQRASHVTSHLLLFLPHELPVIL